MTRIRSILAVLITIAVPFFLMISSVRVLFQPVFLKIEYSLPGFPPDEYGFDRPERLRWATISLTYLLNDSDISYLSEKQLSNGQPLYNERELSHMVDVKKVLKGSLFAWYILSALLLALGVWAHLRRWPIIFWRAVSRGGWATVGLVLLILFGVLVSFDWLFTQFHRIFFTGDTWLFYFSDTLIRLFPMRFWQDGFIAMGALTLLGGLVLACLGQMIARAHAQPK